MREDVRKRGRGGMGQISAALIGSSPFAHFRNVLAMKRSDVYVNFPSRNVTSKKMYEVHSE